MKAPVFSLLLAFVLLAAACQPLPPDTHSDSQTATVSTPTAAVPGAVPSSTLALTPTLRQAVVPSPPPARHDPIVCSPLEGIELKELRSIETTAYDPPAPGHDDGHHGVDFSFYTRGDLKTIQGLPVRSVLSGRVAAAITDRPPYGNFIIVETPLDQIPEFERLNLDLPSVVASPQENPRLQCPPIDSAAGRDRSLYLLYAHLDQPPDLQAGMEVSCGQVVGQVGNSGASGNPHLHLELRVGPSGVDFPAMAHYVNNATVEEMGNYCAWRISGRFQMMDPYQVLDIFLLGDDPFP